MDTQEIYKTMKLAELIRLLIVPFIRIFGAAFKAPKPNKEIMSKLESITENLQILNTNFAAMDIKITKLEKDVNIVIDLHQNSNEVNDLNHIISRTINLYSDNAMTKKILSSVKYDTQQLLNKLLYTDFSNFDFTEFYEELKNIALTKPQVIDKQIAHNDKIERIIKKYCSQLELLVQKTTNGERTKDFIKLSEKLFLEIGEVLLELYPN